MTKQESRKRASWVVVVLASAFLGLGALGCDSQQPCFERGGDCSQANSFNIFGRSDVGCCDSTCTPQGAVPGFGETYMCE